MKILKSKPTVYLPPDAELNFSNTDSAPPKTKYEKSRKEFSRQEVKDLTKGKYGRDR